MAKYSRSSLSLRESLAEISTQRAEQFLNTFYFQYGHRSIADLAHVPMAVERLSLLAAIALVDETRWDGQERSTRYQDFQRSGWYTPALSTGSRAVFNDAAQALFRAYERLSSGMGRGVETHRASARDDDARGLRPHPAGTGVRCGTLSAAAGNEHVTWANRECADAGRADLALAVEFVRRGAHARGPATRGREGARVELAAGPARGDGRRGCHRPRGHARSTGELDAGGTLRADAREVRRAEPLPARELRGSGSGRPRADGRRAHLPRAARRPAG